MKTYKLAICEKRTYQHTVTIRIPDGADIDCICDNIEESATTVDDLECISGIYRTERIVEDTSPECTLEVDSYDEVTETTEETE